MKFRNSSKYWFFCLSILILFLLGCASKSDIKKPEQKTAIQSESKEEQIKEEKILPSPEPALEKIEILDKDRPCRVKISTTIPPTYTVFKLTEPERIIVDLPEILLGEDQKLLEVQNDYITSIKSTQMQDKGRIFLRIEVGLKNDLSYNVMSENNSILIDLNHKTISDSEAGKQEITEAIPTRKEISAKEVIEEKLHINIKDIRISQTPAGHKITIVADSEIEKYHSFSLQKPNRLAIDLPMAKSLLKKLTYHIGSPLIKRVRVGPKQDKVRIVIDLKGKKFPLYQIALEKNYLNVSIKEEEKVSYDIKDEKTLDEEKEPEPEKPEAEEYTGEKISLDFKDADIKNILRLIANISGLNIIVGEGVEAKVTLKLENIPWDEAFDIILETNNLGKVVTKNVTRIETMDRIKKVNEEKLLAKKSQENIEELVFKTIDVSYAKASELAGFIKNLKVLSDRGSVTSFALTNKITIQDIALNVDKIEKLIKQQDVPTRQVLIEARIVQSNPSYVRELGIKWGGVYATTHNKDSINLGGAAGGGGAAAGSGTSIVNLPAAAGVGSGGAINFGYIGDNFALDLQLSAMENEDKLKIISNPRILGLDNKEARIKQGVALPYLKLSEEGVTSTEFKDAVLELTVTPKITPANTIALHIFVTKNQKSAQTGAGNEPGIDIREIETHLLVESGKTIVIGGIYETTKSHNIHKVPLFGDIPYLGYFFKSEKEEDLLTELLVFLTVTVVEQPESIKNIAGDINEISG